MKHSAVKRLWEDYKNDQQNKKHHHAKMNFTLLPELIVPEDKMELAIKCMQVKMTDKKGKKFALVHDFSRIKAPLILKDFKVNASSVTKATCIVCQSKIIKGEPRCKLSVVNSGKEFLDNDISLCHTHIYCVYCFAVLLTSCKPGMEIVCFGTVDQKKGGCKQLSNED